MQESAVSIRPRSDDRDHDHVPLPRGHVRGRHVS
jgi:hypothetical protein